MDIKINTNISNEFNEMSITINAPELTHQLQNIINYLVDRRMTKELNQAIKDK